MEGYGEEGEDDGFDWAVAEAGDLFAEGGALGGEDDAVAFAAEEVAEEAG
jgi:hypothetical protein